MSKKEKEYMIMVRITNVESQKLIKANNLHKALEIAESMSAWDFINDDAEYLDSGDIEVTGVFE